MGYVEVRIQREIHQLRRELREATAREVKTRQGCLDLVLALSELVAGLEAAGVSGASTFKGLLDRAGFQLAPDPTGT